MATDPAARNPRRHIWQLPTFAAGLAAAAAAWAAFPPPPINPADRLVDDLAALRQAIEHKPEAERPKLVEQALPKVLEAADQVPDQAAAAHLLVGTAYLTLAEADPADPEKWALAARHLGKVDPAKLADPADRKRLEYRKAKALAGRGEGDRLTLLAALTKPPPGEDLDGERRRLVAETHLRPPVAEADLRRARDELKAYLSGQTRLPQAALARLTLRLGDIHKTLAEPDEARKRLRELGPSAPADVQAQAKVLLAGLAADEGNWPEAVKLYEAALGNPSLPAEYRGLVRYQTAVAMIQLRNPEGAARQLEQAVREPGPVGAAAAARLAEIVLADPAGKGNRGKVVELLNEAVRDASVGSEFRNPYLSAADVRGAFERAVSVCLAEQDYATAVQATGAYMKVAAAGRGRALRAEVNTAWAAALQQAGGAAEQATAKYREAAEDYLALAEADPAAAADFLRRAADAFRRAGDGRAALALIDRLTRTPGVTPAAAAAAWLDKGELLLTAGQFDEGVKALRQAVEAPGPSSKVALVKLGVAHVEQGRAKLRSATTPAARAEAEGLLDYGQKALAAVAASTADAPAEKDAQQQALYELGKLLLFQQNYAEAETKFRQLVQTYPSGPLGGQGKLYLGSCLLLIARGDNLGGRPPADADRKLAEARQVFEELAKSSDPFLSTHADIRLANTTLLLKQYDEMPALCERLAAKYKGRVEELIVLGMLYYAHANADRPEKAARVLIQMEEVFGKLQDADLAGGAEEYTREYWQKWFESVKAR